MKYIAFILSAIAAYLIYNRYVKGNISYGLSGGGGCDCSKEGCNCAVASNNPNKDINTAKVQKILKFLSQTLPKFKDPGPIDGIWGEKTQAAYILACSIMQIRQDKLYETFRDGAISYNLQNPVIAGALGNLVLRINTMDKIKSVKYA